MSWLRTVPGEPSGRAGKANNSHCLVRKFVLSNLGWPFARLSGLLYLLRNDVTNGGLVGSLLAKALRSVNPLCGAMTHAYSLEYSKRASRWCNVTRMLRNHAHCERPPAWKSAGGLRRPARTRTEQWPARCFGGDQCNLRRRASRLSATGAAGCLSLP